MKYLLKDRDFQIKLDSLSSENKFSDNLLAAVEKAKRLDYRFANISFGPKIEISDPRLGYRYDGYKFIITIELKDIEEVKEYDPNIWNKYPDVEPSKYTWMCCERTINGSVFTYYCKV